MNFYINELWERIISIFRKRELDDDLNEELASHIEMATEDNIRSGMNPLEARRQALIRFGGIDAVKEQHRDTRGLPLIENVIRDTRYAFRMFFKNPGFSLAVIITLALCIGANTAIFSMLDALVLRPLPFNDSDRIVSVYTKNSEDSKMPSSNVAQYKDFKDNVDGFLYLALWENAESNLYIGNEAIRAPGISATPGIFDVLGINPVLGRFFSAENGVHGDIKEVILTESFWVSHFQRNPKVIGRTIQINSEIYEVVGIVPKAFEYFNAQPRFIIPYKAMPWQLNNRYGYAPFLLGRLKRDASIEAVSAQMTALERKALENAPPFMQDMVGGDKISIGLDALQSIRIDNDLRLKLYLLQGAVLFVLLIGCVNIINLFLSRSNTRQGELAVRIALGAGKKTVSRQLLVESFLLTWIGSALGVVLALGIISVINASTAKLLPTSLPFTIDGRMLLFTVIITVLTSLIIALFQIFHLFGSNLLTLTQNQSSRMSGGHSLRSTSGVLITAQMAITFVLLIGAGLLIHSFANLLTVDHGFNPDKLITARISLPSDYNEENRADKFREQLRYSLQNIPGILSVSLPVSTPYNGGPVGNMGFSLEGYDQPENGHSNATFLSVDSSYFETMQIPLIEGRWFNESDNSKSRPVCVVNQAFVRQYVSGKSAVGIHCTFRNGDPEENWQEIIGVVGTVRDLVAEERWGARARNLPSIYHPIQQSSFSFPGLSTGVTVVVRSPRPASEVITLLREKVKEIDPALPLYQTGSMKSMISRSFNQRRAIMLLLCSFAGIALILSSVGIYGVLAYDVSTRTHEIGIRSSIGATEKQIIYMVLRQGLLKTGIGLLIGIVVAFYLSKLMTSLLFEVKPIDPLTFVLVPILLLFVAILASYIPARQASRVDPALALRAE